MARSKNYVCIGDKIPRHRDNILQMICFKQRYSVKVRILSSISTNKEAILGLRFGLIKLFALFGDSNNVVSSSHLCKIANLSVSL